MPIQASGGRPFKVIFVLYAVDLHKTISTNFCPKMD